MRARELRSTSTDAERLLWQRLRNRQLAGRKFRRQHPVGGYFADFACVEAGLVIELDGSQHAEPKAAQADRRRSAVLQRHGFTVIRFDDRQVLTETDAVLATILAHIDTPHPHPLPRAGEGKDQESP